MHARWTRRFCSPCPWARASAKKKSRRRRAISRASRASRRRVAGRPNPRVRQPRRRRDATRPPRRIAVAGPATAGQSWETSARASSRARVAVCVHPARGSCFERYKPFHFFSDVFWAVSAEFVCFFPPFGAGENRVQSGRCRPSFLGRDFGCHPGISFRFHLETHVHAGDLSGRSTAVGWRLEPTRSRRVAAPHH